MALVRRGSARAARFRQPRHRCARVDAREERARRLGRACGPRASAAADLSLSRDALSRASRLATQMDDVESPAVRRRSTARANEKWRRGEYSICYDSARGAAVLRL